MSKYYGQEFKVFPESPYPTKAICWNSLEEVKIQYEEFCADCEKYDQIPLSHFVYIGEPDGDEEKYGYPEYPDYVISFDSQEKVLIRKI